MSEDKVRDVQNIARNIDQTYGKRVIFTELGRLLTLVYLTLFTLFLNGFEFEFCCLLFLEHPHCTVMK